MLLLSTCFSSMLFSKDTFHSIEAARVVIWWIIFSKPKQRTLDAQTRESSATPTTTQRKMGEVIWTSKSRDWTGSSNFWRMAPCGGEGDQETWLCACPAHGTGRERGGPPPLGSPGNFDAAGKCCDSGKQDPQLPTTTSWWIEWVKIYDLPSQLHCLWHN